MTSSTESRDVDVSEPPFGPEAVGVTWSFGLDPFELLRRGRFYRGDSGGLAEVELDFEHDGKQLPDIGRVTPSRPQVIDLGDLLDSLQAFDHVDSETASQIESAVFPTERAPARDWAQMSCVAAGVVQGDEPRRAFTGDTTPTGLKSLRTWASDQMTIRGAKCDALPLVVSELATNVERYTPGWVIIDLIFHDRELIVAATDGGPGRLPRLAPSQEFDVSGRGLWIVAELSLAWGVIRGPNSKTVWSLLTCDYEV